MATFPPQTITVSIARDWREVYDFASVPQNFPRWAAGLGTRFERSGEEWTAEGPDGRPIRIRFSPPNGFGVLDHTVFTEDGSETLNAMRVVANGSGAEVMFTLLKAPGTTQELFAADAAAVERDLNSLKTLLERELNPKGEASLAKSRDDQRIDYVEFSVGDIGRSRNFYGEAFGWSFKDYGPSYCEFSDGRLTGGFALRGNGIPGRINGGGPLVILYARDLDETRSRIEQVGGEILMPAYSFPGGRRFHFADPDGYELAVWSDR
jgi:predicted enzyme related to lactoylglutathione lyase